MDYAWLIDDIETLRTYLTDGYTKAVLKQASNAIEELQQTVEHYKGCADDWYQEACDYKALAPKWIPVEERLPENNTWVLAHSKYKGHVVDYVDINGLWSYGNVTHWMPLPEPPKEETE